jgi:hypothetical protein
VPLPVQYPAALDSLASPGSGTYADDAGFFLDEVITRIHGILALLEANRGLSESPAQDTPLASTVLGSLTNGKSKWTGTPTVASVRVGAGSAAAPSVLVNGTDRGLYDGGTNLIGFSAAGGAAATLGSATSNGLAMGTNVPIVPAAVSGTPLAHGLYRGNVVKGWANLAGTDATLNANFNVSGTTDGGGGGMTVTWDRDFLADNFAVVATCLDTPSGTTATLKVCMCTNGPGTTQVYQMRVSDGAQSDVARLGVIAIGNQ